MTEVSVKAEPLPIVRTVLSDDAVAFYQRVVQMVKRGRDSKHGMVSRNCITYRFAMIGRQATLVKPRTFCLAAVHEYIQ